MKTFLTLFVLFFSSSVFAEGCISGDCIGGFGTFTLTNGDKYVGEFKNNLMNGQGAYTFADGEVTNGIWENGELAEENSEIVKPKETQLEILEGCILEVIWENHELSEEY
mgnify:CR=1 FL=1